MRINAFTVIHIKQPEVRQPFAGRRTDLCQDVLRRHVLVHQQRQVAAYFGEARQLAELRQVAVDHFGQQQLEEEHRLLEVEFLRQFLRDRHSLPPGIGSIQRIILMQCILEIDE
ncbi:hypothetical protein Z046_31510 [Pseudomonas aeruginosa VRFPA09]|nr:hypothetical protein Z046_31510 [Pseudomonas aeruginosa VRFPA09]